MDAIIMLFPDSIEPKDEEDWVEAKSMIGSLIKSSNTKIEFEKVNLCSLVMWSQRVNYIYTFPQKVVTEGGKTSCNDSWYKCEVVMISF